LLGVPPELMVIVDLPGVAGQGRLRQVGRQWRGTVGLTLGPVSVTGLAILDTGDPPSLVVLLAAEFQPTRSGSRPRSRPRSASRPPASTC
jgi:hypothetical protein